MVLRALGPEREIDYDSDDDTVPARLPLLRNQAQNGPNYVETNLPRRSDSWTVRILDKVRCQQVFPPLHQFAVNLYTILKALQLFLFRLTNKFFLTLHGEPSRRSTKMFHSDP